MKKLSLACALLALCCLLPALACAALPEYEYTQELTYCSFTLRIPSIFVPIEVEAELADDEYVDNERNVHISISYYPEHFAYKNTGDLIGYCLSLKNEWFSDCDSYEFAQADECLATVISEYGFASIHVYSRGHLFSILIANLNPETDTAEARKDCIALAYALLEHIVAPEMPLE